MLQDHVLPNDEEAARFVDKFERLRDPSHHRAFAEAEWMAMFRRAGIVVEHSEHYLKRHDFIPWARRQGNEDATIAKLIQMVQDAPWQPAGGWIRKIGGAKRRPSSIGIF